MKKILCFLLASLAFSPCFADQVEPLSEQAQTLLANLDEDPEPEELGATREDLKNRHYLCGDEAHLELFYDDLKDLGGVYFGVGTDQAYLFAGWMKPDLAFVTDYDPWIKRMHRAYYVFFEAADNIDDFVNYWDPKNAKSTRAFLKEKLGSEYRSVVEVFNEGSQKAHRRLKRLQKWMKNAKVPSFVTDDAQYQYVREMVLKGRFKAVVGNLADTHALQSIAKISKDLGYTVRAIYPSNAEQYWKKYPTELRDNMAAQPFDEKSIIVRTFATHPLNDDYQYNIQGAYSFTETLKAGKVKNIRGLIDANKPKDTFPLTRIENKASDMPAKAEAAEPAKVEAAEPAKVEAEPAKTEAAPEAQP